MSQKRMVECPECGHVFEANRNSILLKLLKRDGEMTAMEIAKKLGITHAGALWILKELIREGAVQKKRIHWMPIYAAKVNET